MASSVHSTVSGNTAKPFSTQINVISSGTKKSINENIKEAIVARLGSSSRKKTPYPGTCEWLGKIGHFASWVRDEPESRGLLWVCGNPGKGKTHLATRLVTRLRTGSVMTELGGALSTSALGNDCIVLSYFCDASNVLHSTELAVVLGLLNQLLELKDSEEFYQIISPKFSGRGQDLFTGPFIQDLWDCLEQIIRVIVQRRQIYIVLDGLDECDRPSQTRLSSQMRSICHEGRQDEKNPLRIVIFSRPLNPSLPPMDPIIDLDVVENRQGTNADISIFVENKCRLQRDKDRFCKLLTDRSEGTFLWVALAISLLDETSVQQKIVDEDPAFLDKLLPVGLPGMYDRILFNIADSLHGKTHHQDMMKIFRCLTVSQRPLTREEIGTLTEMNEYIVNEALSAFGHILSTTGGVSDEEAIELIHLSLRQCIAVMSDVKKGLKRDIHDAESPSHLQNQLEIKKRWRRVQYPSRHWVAHLKEIEAKSSAIDKVDTFLKQHFLHWLEAMAHLGVVSGSLGDLDIIREIARVNARSELSEFLYDARRFLLKNRHMAEIAPLQLYYAGLIFAPANSIVRQHFKSEIRRLCLLPKVEESWSEDLQTLEGHSRAVNSVAFSPNGQTIASGSDDCTIKLWDARTGQELQTLKGHSAFVSSVAFSPDGQTIASGSYDNTIKIWDTRTGQELQTLKGHSEPVNSVAFSPDSQTIASGSNDYTIKVWNTQTGQETQTLQGYSNSVFSVAFSSDGQTKASGSNDYTIKLRDTRIGQELRTLEFHRRLIECVAFSPDGQTIASGSSDCIIKLWDTQTGQELQSLNGHSGRIRSIAFSADGQTIASGSSDCIIKLWDTQTGQETRTLQGHSGSVQSIAFSPDGQTIASGLVDSIIKLWDTQTGQELRTLEGHSEPVTSVAFSPDSQTIASGSDDHTIKVWDARTDQELTDQETRTPQGHSSSVRYIALSPDGQTIASASYDRTIKLWDARTGQETRTLQTRSYLTQPVAFSSDSQIIASGLMGQIIELWDAQTGQELGSLEGHPHFASSVVFSDPQSPILQLFIKDECVFFQNQMLLWLPSEYRHFNCLATCGSTMVFGYENGRIVILRLDVE